MKNRFVFIGLFFSFFYVQAVVAQDAENDSVFVSESTDFMMNLSEYEDTLSLPLIDEKLKFEQTIYDRPYSLWENQPNYKRLRNNSFLLLGGCVAVAGLLYVMPESVSKWDKETMSFNSLFNDWWDNVSSGPVIDKDDFAMNYISHPYCGAIYYMGARSAGCNAAYSLLYSFLLSTFFWEYGIEAFAEIPSIQDLIITPIGGALLGEAFYLAKREIVNNNYRLLNSKILGYAAICLMDPLNEIINLLPGSHKKRNSSLSNISFSSFPKIEPNGSLSYQLSLNVMF